MFVSTAIYANKSEVRIVALSLDLVSGVDISALFPKAFSIFTHTVRYVAAHSIFNLNLFTYFKNHRTFYFPRIAMCLSG